MNKLDAARQDWYPVAMIGELHPGEEKQSRLLEDNIILRGGEGGVVTVHAGDTQWLTQSAYGHVWTSPSPSPRALFAIPEASENGRKLVNCGVVRVKCSPLRAVENFLDVAHFPFVHTDVLGAEPHTEVEPYQVTIDEANDEVLATEVKFFQPQAAKSAGGGIVTDYVYRVPSPMVALLYKTCPPKPEAQDVIGLFVQPLDEETCDVWAWMVLYDDETPMAELIQFQQMIFLQDRSILENQLPRKLPLQPGLEIPTHADGTSSAYRRWLKKRGAYYGAVESA